MQRDVDPLSGECIKSGDKFGYSRLDNGILLMNHHTERRKFSRYIESCVPSFRKYMYDTNVPYLLSAGRMGDAREQRGGGGGEGERG